MPSRLDTISFLSDFGTGDEFVGVVHSVIRSIAPGTAVIDITHDIRPFDVKGAGFTLARSVQYLCPGIVLAVVDPGVGTDRRAVAIEVGDGQAYLVGPDNGLLASAVSIVGGATAAVELTASEYQLPSPGPTFAGRDVFGPAAAHLSTGVPLEALGRAIDPAGLMPGLVPLPREEDGALVGEVLWVDRYGNCQINVDPDEIAAWGERVQLRWTTPRPGVRTAVRAHTYGDLATSQVGLVVDSYGMLAVSVRNGSAADTLGLETGDELALVPLDDEPDQPDPAAGATDAGGAADAAGSTGGRPAGTEPPGRTSPVTLHPRKPS